MMWDTMRLGRLSTARRHPKDRPRRRAPPQRIPRQQRRHLAIPLTRHPRTTPASAPRLRPSAPVLPRQLLPPVPTSTPSSTAYSRRLPPRRSCSASSGPALSSPRTCARAHGCRSATSWRCSAWTWGSTSCIRGWCARRWRGCEAGACEGRGGVCTLAS